MQYLSFESPFIANESTLFRTGRCTVHFASSQWNSSLTLLLWEFLQRVQRSSFMGRTHLQENRSLNLIFKSYFPAFSVELPLKSLLQSGCRALIRSSGTSGREHQLVPCHFISCSSSVTRPWRTHSLLPALLSAALLWQETTERTS